MLRFFHIGPHDVRRFTMGELRRMAESLDDGGGVVTDGP